MAGNYAFSDSASLRASAGTGFRAPTPGQISTTNVSTRINDAGVPVAEGIFPATHPVSKFFGAEPLDAEDSTQVTLGLAATPLSRLTISVDYYFIELRERFDVMGRAHWYADYRHANSANFADPENIQQFGGKILFDLQAAWRIGDTYTLTLGGQNVFGETPDRARFEACCGRIYRSDSMIPWQGAYYYLRLAAGI